MTDIVTGSKKVRHVYGFWSFLTARPTQWRARIAGAYHTERTGKPTRILQSIHGAFLRSGLSNCSPWRVEELLNPLISIPENEKWVEHPEPRPSSERVSCPMCGKMFAGGAVVTLPPFVDPRHPEQGTVCMRRFYCDLCQHVILWKEHVSSGACPIPDGVVLGQEILLDNPQYVSAFLANHPQADGVAQA